MRVAIYARVSTQHQAQAQTIEQQLERLTAYVEQIHFQEYLTRAEARTDIFAYIEGFYNRVRRHSSLGYLSPAEFERLYYDNLP